MGSAFSGVTPGVGKRAGIFGVIIAVTALIGVGVAMVDPNVYKPRIVAAVQAATGRELTINGPLRISLSVWPTIELSDVTLANLPGGTRPDMARVEHIAVRLSLPALLRRRIEVSKLTLIGPNILLELVHGQPNWEFGAKDPNPVIMQMPRPGGSFGSGTNLRIRNAHIQNGMITFKAPARTKVLGIRTLDLQHHTDDGPIDLSAAFVYSDNQPFTLIASATPVAGVSRSWDTQLKFSALGATALAKGTINLVGGYDLRIDAQASALERLNALLPDMQLPALHQASLSTHLTNGPVPGDLPVIGTTSLRFQSADLGDRVPGLTVQAVDVTLPIAGAAAAISADGRFRNQAFTLGGSFGVPLHPDGPTNVPIDLTIQTGSSENPNKRPGVSRGSLAVKGTLALHTGRFAGLNANVALRLSALAELSGAASHPLPTLTDVGLDAQLALPADLGALRLRNAKLSAHEAEITGDATIGLGATVALNSQLHASRIDLDALLGLDAPPQADTTKNPIDPTKPVIPATALDWAVFRGPTVDVTANVAALTFHRQIWHDVKLGLRLKDGRLQLDPLQIALPDGSLAMSMTADTSVDNVPIDLDVHSAAIPLALIGRYAGLPGPMTGNIKLDGRLHAVGGNLRDIASSLDGSLSASLNGGSLSNAALLELASSPLDALSIEVPAHGTTAINCVDLIGSFSKGVGRFKTIGIDTTYLKSVGAGQIDLATETIALKLHPMARISGSSVSVPVVVEGPFRAVQARLDAFGLDKLGLLLDAWFGGDSPDTCVQTDR